MFDNADVKNLARDLATQTTILNALSCWYWQLPAGWYSVRTRANCQFQVEVATTAPQAGQGGEAVPTAATQVIQPPEIVTLAVTPQEAVMLTYSN